MARFFGENDCSFCILSEILMRKSDFLTSGKIVCVSFEFETAFDYNNGGNGVRRACSAPNGYDALLRIRGRQ